MKRNQITKFYSSAIIALLLGGASMAVAQTTDYTVNEFPSSGTYQGNPFNNSTGTTPLGCGIWYGSGTILFDGTTADPNSTGDGSAYISVNLNDQSCAEDYITPLPYDNLWYNGNPAGVDLSQYVAIHFDVKWDTTFSTVGIAQFNNTTNWPTDLLQPWAPTNYLQGSDPYANGLEVDVAGTGNPTFIGNVDIPWAASNGWAQVTLPITPTLAGLNGACGILFKKWINQPWGEVSGNQVFFWVSHVWFEGSAAPPPPPIVQAPVASTAGLNIISSTSGNSFYDRQQVCLVSSNNLSWVGHATVGNPVDYSFTINGFPQDPAAQFGCEAYLMMSPNPAFYDNALDWNETNCIVVSLQQGNGSTIMNFTFKTNNPGGASGYVNIGTVTNTGAASALGTWQVKFTSDSGGTLIAPNGNTGSFTFPGGSAATFAESSNPGFYIYLGMQANNAASMNQAVSYSQFSVTGVAAAQSDNFLTDSTLNTNKWFNSMATGPAGVFVNPTPTSAWVKWNTPAGGFKLQAAASLLGPWNRFTNDLVIQGAGQNYQLVTTNDIPAGTSAQFFELAKP